MIHAESDSMKRDEYLKRLMDLPNQVGRICCTTIFLYNYASSILYELNLFYNDCCGNSSVIVHLLLVEMSYVIFLSFALQKWAEIIGQAGRSVDVLKDQDIIRTILNILQVMGLTFLFSFALTTVSAYDNGKSVMFCF